MIKTNKKCWMCRWFRALKNNMSRCEWHEFRRDREDLSCTFFDGVVTEDDFEARRNLLDVKTE